MDHHNLAIIRGDRKNPQLAAPLLAEYGKLYDYIQSLWSDREEGRYGSIVEPMLQWAKTKTLRTGSQAVACSAGNMSAVVYANGDVGVCEIHEPIGNLRENTFPEIWNSEAAEKLRQSIKNKECHCTTEVFMWPSIVFNPLSLSKAIVGAKVWKAPEPLRADQLIPLRIDTSGMPAAERAAEPVAIEVKDLSSSSRK